MAARLVPEFDMLETSPVRRVAGEANERCTATDTDRRAQPGRLPAWPSVAKLKLHEAQTGPQ